MLITITHSLAVHVPYSPHAILHTARSLAVHVPYSPHAILHTARSLAVHVPYSPHAILHTARSLAVHVPYSPHAILHTARSLAVHVPYSPHAILHTARSLAVHVPYSPHAILHTTRSLAVHVPYSPHAILHTARSLAVHVPYSPHAILHTARSLAVHMPYKPAREAMESCSTCPDWEQRPRCAECLSVRCCLRMMLPSLLTQRKLSREWLTASLKPAKDFGLTISLKKTSIIHIDNYNLEVVSAFTYLGLTMSSNLSLEPELSRRIGKASSVMSRLSKRVWENKKLTLNTKMKV